jgi:hypothetical protein
VSQVRVLPPLSGKPPRTRLFLFCALCGVLALATKVATGGVRGAVATEHGAITELEIERDNYVRAIREIDAAEAREVADALLRS